MESYKNSYTSDNIICISFKEDVAIIVLKCFVMADEFFARNPLEPIFKKKKKIIN